VAQPSLKVLQHPLPSLVRHELFLNTRNQAQQHQNHAPKIQLAFFEGPKPLDWLFQAEQYFSFYQIPLEQRLSMVAFHMKGEALS